MQVMTLNTNGIRAAKRKGFFEWVQQQNPDIICIQETKAQIHKLEDQLQIPGYYLYYHDAQKPGYSGVAIYTRYQPQNVQVGLDFPLIDEEGRHIRADWEHLTVISAYFPSGSSGEHRQQKKYEFLDFYENYIDQLLADQKPFVICGDWNIVHTRKDIRNWNSNQKSSGCLPEERAWIDNIFNQKGCVDTFRVINQNAEEYSWWSFRGQAWSKNVGWRIDYQVASPELKQAVKDVDIYRQQRFSDHAPVTIDYDLDKVLSDV